jgi:tetratricopeptide (TPR) repeat protein
MRQNQHISASAISSFPSLSHQERVSFFAHAEECPACAATFLETWQLRKSPAPTPRISNFSAVLDRVVRNEAALLREREQAVELQRELLQHPNARQQTLVMNSRRFWTRGLCEALLDTSKNAVYENPNTAVHLAELSQEIATRLDPESYGATLHHDLIARTWLALAEALWASSDLRRADEALSEAERELECGTGDPLEMAKLAYLRGGLRSSQRRFAESITNYDKAIAIYRRMEDRHLQAKGLISKGIALSKAGDPEASIRLQRQALEMVDGQREPRSLLAAHHNLLVDLTAAGRVTEALEQLGRVRALHSKNGEAVNQLRLLWIEGQLLRQQGDREAAEHALLQVKDAFSKLEVPYDWALASLELATLYAEQGRTAEIKQLAVEMIQIFQALEIQRETIAALMLFRQAAEAETATLALIQHIAGFLKRAEHDPALRFSAPE